MWFDAKARLAEIRAAAADAHPAPAPATSPAAEGRGRIAQIARIARPPPAERETAPDPDDCRYGFAFDGSPRTWCGTIVSLEEWRGLTEWQRHGPNGRLFCGRCWQWRERETALACLDGRPCR